MHVKMQRCLMFSKIEFYFTVYSNAIQENMNSLLYPGLIEELVDIVELKDNTFVVSSLIPTDVIQSEAKI
jgi:E3 ubiquitin-protein ligase HUWE1